MNEIRTIYWFKELKLLYSPCEYSLAHPLVITSINFVISLALLVSDSHHVNIGRFIFKRDCCRNGEYFIVHIFPSVIFPKISFIDMVKAMHCLEPKLL